MGVGAEGFDDLFELSLEFGVVLVPAAEKSGARRVVMLLFGKFWFATERNRLSSCVTISRVHNRMLIVDAHNKALFAKPH